ncbi:hypothetical protein JQ625_06295 [Bradyrhizobium diazoefficiens]|nr:hypothetical protein [Bradyrhizobium diazoefficiens]MBR0774438.1 hypothetical protein [Bradyrhizobium diazoefficiens]
MNDMQVQLDKLLAEAANCAMIARQATDQAKRELFLRLAEHYNVLAGEVRKAITDSAKS